VTLSGKGLNKGGTDVRRAILLVAMMALTLLVASGVALAVTKIGTDGPDTLRGTNGSDNLEGRGGNDVLFALGGRDNLLGEKGKDWVYGGDERRPFGGNKNLVGGGGNDGVVGGIGSDNALGGSGNDFVLGDYGSDRVEGEEGKDLVLGSRGADRVVGGEGTDQLLDGPIDDAWTDTLSGGDGDDIFLVDNVPAGKDIVSCGRGFDRIVADRKDVVGDDCEKVRVVHGSIEEVFQQEEAFFESIPPAVLEFFGTFFEEQLAPDPTAGG
jgi:hemolysin type calcium-binding protein